MTIALIIENMKCVILNMKNFVLGQKSGYTNYPLTSGITGTKKHWVIKEWSMRENIVVREKI